MSKSQTCKQIANTVWNKSHELNLTKGRLCKSSEEKVKNKKDCENNTDNCNSCTTHVDPHV